MKIKTGGGGIDKDGKFYQLPGQEIEVADTWVGDLLAFLAACNPVAPTRIIVSREVAEYFRRGAKAK